MAEINLQNEMQRIQELEQKMQAQMHELQQQSQPVAEEPLPDAVPHNKNSPTLYIFIKQHQPMSVYLNTQVSGQTAIATEQHLNLTPTISQLNEFKVAV